jgi:WD40 repeat protein
VRYAGGIIKVWDIQTHTKRYELTGFHSGAHARWYAFDCTFSPDHQLLAVGDAKRGGVAFFSAGSGDEIRHIRTPSPASCLAFSSDGGRLAIGSISGPYLSVYEMEGNGAITTISVPSPVYHVAWHPDGIQLAVASSDFNIYLCDPSASDPVGVLKGHRQEVTQVIFTPNGDRLISTARDRMVRLWSTNALTQEVCLLGYGSEPAMRLAADGRRMVITDASPNAYAVTIGGADPLCRTMVNGSPVGRATLVGSIDFSSDSKRLVTSTFESVDMWDVDPGRLLATFAIDAGAEKSVRFGPDNQTVLIGSRLSGLAYYQVNGRHPTAKLTLREQLDNNEGFIFSNTPPGDDNLVGLTANQLGVARVFDLTTRRSRFELSNAPFVWDLALSPDQNYLALAFSNQAPESAGNIQIWSLKDRKHILTLPGGRNNIARFTPDGKWIKSSGDILRDSVWSTKTWEPAKLMNYAGSWHVFSEARNWAAGLSLEKDRILIMELSSGRLLFALESPILPGSSFRLASSPDGRYLAAQSADNTICIWNLEKLQASLAGLGL